MMHNFCVTADSTKLLPLTVLLFFVAMAWGVPGYAQIPAQEDRYTCTAYQFYPEGRWRAARDVIPGNGTATATRDVYEWEPKKDIEFAPGMILNWDMVYYWPTTTGRQKRIAEAEILVDLQFTFDAKDDRSFEKPDLSWLHFYRTADAGKPRSPLATSLSTMTMWHQYGPQRLRTRAIISADDLLAFGTGRDQLEWDIRLPINEFGRTQTIAKGHLPIAPVREAATSILKLRSALDRKAAKFRKHCQIVPRVPALIAK